MSSPITNFRLEFLQITQPTYGQSWGPGRHRVEPSNHYFAYDSTDNVILATAVASRVEGLASGDKADLLTLRTIHGIPIITAQQALARLMEQEEL